MNICFVQKHLKPLYVKVFYRGGSSVGEHTTEARGVGGSIPSRPILWKELSLAGTKTFLEV